MPETMPMLDCLFETGFADVHVTTGTNVKATRSREAHNNSMLRAQIRCGVDVE